MTLLLLGSGGAGSAGGGGSAESAAFLARTSGLDATHISAYTALIDGLVADGVWSKLDALYVFATDTSANALLSLVSSTYNATAVGSPTFTADRGFSGAFGKYVDTNFIPGTASTPKFVQNSAHISSWSVTNIGSDGQPQMGTSDGTANVDIFPNFGGNSFFFMNANPSIGVSNANSSGHYISNRSASNAVQGYKNGSSTVTGSNSSTTVPSFKIVVGGQNNSGSVSASAYQTAGASIGSSLSGTDAGNFYTRMRTYMSAVGVP